APRRKAQWFSMARPLLPGFMVCYGWAAMRALLALFVCQLAAGCLYTDEINQPPQVHLRFQVPPRSDRPFQISVDSFDPDGDQVDLNWSVQSPAGIPPQANSTGANALVQVEPHGPGDYGVAVVARDVPGGAITSVSVAIPVPNMAPRIKSIAAAPPLSWD